MLCLRVCVCVCRDHTSCLLSCSPHYFLRQNLLLNLEFICLMRLAGQQALESFLFLPPQPQDNRSTWLFWRCWGLKKHFTDWVIPLVPATLLWKCLSRCLCTRITVQTTFLPARLTDISDAVTSHTKAINLPSYQSIEYPIPLSCQSHNNLNVC